MKTILYFQTAYCEIDRLKLNGLCRYAKSARWRVQVVQQADSVDQDGKGTGVRRLLAFWKPDGIVFDSGQGLSAPCRRAFGSVPFVFGGHVTDPRTPCIESDEKAVAEAAAHELLSRQCAAYLYVPYWHDVDWSRRRGEAFADLVCMNGYKCLVFRPRRFGVKAETYRSWLCEWLANAPTPCGIFAANDYVAEVVLQCAAKAGLKARRDFFLIGVDDDASVCERCSPTLTSVILDYERAGYAAGELLERVMSGSSRHGAHVKFGVVGVRHRESTFVYRRTDDHVAEALEYIRREACGNCRVADVVRVMSCSRRMAEVRFREVSGHSILQEIQSVRVERAKQLLAKTDLPVCDIAIQCGYSTTEQLRRLFLVREGKTPRDWRRS